jgi:hypothetical protein
MLSFKLGLTVLLTEVEQRDTRASLNIFGGGGGGGEEDAIRIESIAGDEKVQLDIFWNWNVAIILVAVLDECDHCND